MTPPLQGPANGPGSRVTLVCLLIFGNTFSIGAFTVLLPDIGRSGGFSDLALGAIAGAFGLARLLADLPAGLYVNHHLRRSLCLASILLGAGLILLATGASAWMLIAGRLLLGAGHSLGMLAGITLIIRHGRPERQGVSLNAYEMSGMLGVLGGIAFAGFLPRDWSWSASLILASSPQALALVILPGLLARLPLDRVTGPPSTAPRDTPAASSRAPSPADEAPHTPTAPCPAVPLSLSYRLQRLLPFAAGAAIAFSWSAVGTFVLPLRADRVFELDRQGIALLSGIAQAVDVLALMPFGMLADRFNKARLLGTALLIMALAMIGLTQGGLPIAVGSSILLGIALAAWMLPIGLVHQDIAPDRIAWRTGVYRLGVDGGVFLGPIAAGLLSEAWGAGAVGFICALMLSTVGLGLLRWKR